MPVNMSCAISDKLGNFCNAYNYDYAGVTGWHNIRWCIQKDLMVTIIYIFLQLYFIKRE